MFTVGAPYLMKLLVPTFGSGIRLEVYSVTLQFGEPTPVLKVRS